MTASYTTSLSATFSTASARYVASKIATDLRQLQRYYGAPPDAKIDNFATEATVLARHGGIKKVSYGFRREGSWILTLEYTWVNGNLQGDDRAGGIPRNADIQGAEFYSYLEYSPEWFGLSDARRQEIEEQIPLTRGGASPPTYTGGYHTPDRTYSSDNSGFTRSSYRPL